MQKTNSMIARYAEEVLKEPIVKDHGGSGVDKHNLKSPTARYENISIVEIPSYTLRQGEYEPVCVCFYMYKLKRQMPTNIW